MVAHGVAAKQRLSNDGFTHMLLVTDTAHHTHETARSEISPKFMCTIL